MELACYHQRACAVGLAPVILCEAGVPAFIHSRYIENLQASIFPNEDPEEDPELIFHKLRSIKYSTRSEGQKSSVLFHGHMHDEKWWKFSEKAT